MDSASTFMFNFYCKWVIRFKENCLPEIVCGLHRSLQNCVDFHIFARGRWKQCYDNSYAHGCCVKHYFRLGPPLLSGIDAPTILRSQVQVPSTPSMLLSSFVKFCSMFVIELGKGQKFERPWFGLVKKIILSLVYKTA